MNNTQQKLFKLAQATAQNAHCPYSKFKVGAAIYADNGGFYAGCNVENVSFPVGTCAEQGAISAMVADGASKIKAILIYSEGKNLISPCGACRQRIAEFADSDTIVYLADSETVKQELSASDLLPFSFSDF